MERNNKNGKLVALIVAVVVIAVLVALFGTVCTCLCTFRACLGWDGCMPSCSEFEWLPDHSDAWLETDEPSVALETAPPATQAPTAVPETLAPTASESLSPFDDEHPAATQAPSDPSAWVRPHQVQLKNDGTDTVTVLVLMNGSDLESEYGEASDDLAEMVRAKKSDRVNILLETVGTKKWDKRFGISSRRSERYRVTESGLKLLDGTLPQLDTTIPSTLSDFIRWGAETCPADRYILLLWDHGGGPVYGFGYDEFQPYTATLTIDEMQTALSDGGVYFDMIGMDCCLMSSLEVCCALYDYCDYTLLSEDFEPGCGWSHEGWLSALANDPAIDTEALAKVAIDDSIRYAERRADEDDGMTLALIDESYLTLLYPAWVEFAYANEETLLSRNYSQLRESTGRVHPRILRPISEWFTEGDATLDDYYITDMLSLSANIVSTQSDALSAALKQAIAYYGATSGETTLSGLSVTLPYGDRAFYDELRRVFINAGIDETYVDWLKKFVSVETETAYYDFGNWGGWDDYSGGYDWGDWGGLFGGYDDWTEDWTGDWDVGGVDIDDVLNWLFG
ncbi:MAG: hypothetical protein IKZ44_03915 [Clostridia bacterium]|nr:hypothetical protein [Clostridia bacterium]